MELQHEFTVPVPIDQAWSTLLDLEQVAPCMPGASLESFDGHAFTGKVKVKVGPITVTYRGEGEFAERDDSGHLAVISARGKEARGSGTANAKITTALVSEGDHTRVKVSTDLAITGRPAQFGRGVMNDVGAKLIGQFADCLAAELTGPAAPAEAPAPGAGGVVGEAAPAEAVTRAAPAREEGRREERAPDEGARAGAGEVRAGEVRAPAVEPPWGARPVREAEPIDLLEAAGGPVLKRLAPLLGVVALLLLIWWLARRRGRHG